jgi:serine-type D-Ala-D-Ala carboxypeptidase/endopeptidase
MNDKEIPARLTRDHCVVSRFLVVSFVLLLLTSSFAAISITFSPAFGYYSTSSSTANLSISKEIPAQVKNFIANQVVNKSKAAIVIGFVDPDGTRIFSFGNMSTAHNIPVNESTIFHIGSITKTFTTLILADMVRHGLVNLNDPVEKYLPAGVKVPDYKGHKITIEELATHTSALPEFPSNYGAFLPEARILDPNYNASNYTAKQLYQALSNLTLTTEPGSNYRYSNFGMGLLGHILSLKAGGISYEQLVTDKILNVLGMNDTRITLSDAFKARLATGHKSGQDIKTPELPEVLAGAGEFRSSATDLLKYASANLGLIHSKLDGAIQESHLIIKAAQFKNIPGYYGYTGLGWRILTDLGTENISHPGGINGYNSFIGFSPAKQIGIVILCSCDNTDVNVENMGFALLHVPVNITSIH